MLQYLFIPFLIAPYRYYQATRRFLRNRAGSWESKRSRTTGSGLENEQGKKEESQMEILNAFRDMGILGWGVTVILGLMSIWSMNIMVGKMLLFRAARKATIPFHSEYGGLLTAEKFTEAIEVARRYGKSHLAQVVLPGLQEYENERAKLPETELEAAVERVLDQEVTIRGARMKQQLSGLATIGSTAPFIGLFGTVLGIMNAFLGMETMGSGSLAAVSGGIAEALINTAMGLLVAIPAVMMYNRLTSVLDRLQLEMTAMAGTTMHHLKKKHAREPTST